MRVIVPHVLAITVLICAALTTTGCEAPANLSVSPSSLAWSEADSASRELIITNTGREGLWGRDVLEWEATADVAWLTLVPKSGSDAKVSQALSSGEDVKSLVTVMLERSKLPPGRSEGAITVTSNGEPTGTVVIDVTAEAGEAQEVSIQYLYDRCGRLTSVTYSDGTVIEYDYDANGNRRSQRVTTP